MGIGDDASVVDDPSVDDFISKKMRRPTGSQVEEESKKMNFDPMKILELNLNEKGKKQSSSKRKATCAADEAAPKKAKAPTTSRKLSNLCSKAFGPVKGFFQTKGQKPASPKDKDNGSSSYVASVQGPCDAHQLEPVLGRNLTWEGLNDEPQSSTCTTTFPMPPAAGAPPAHVRLAEPIRGQDRAARQAKFVPKTSTATLTRMAVNNPAFYADQDDSPPPSPPRYCTPVARQHSWRATSSFSPSSRTQQEFDTSFVGLPALTDNPVICVAAKRAVVAQGASSTEAQGIQPSQEFELAQDARSLSVLRHQSASSEPESSFDFEASTLVENHPPDVLQQVHPMRKSGSTERNQSSVTAPFPTEFGAAELSPGASSHQMGLFHEPNTSASSDKKKSYCVKCIYPGCGNSTRTSPGMTFSKFPKDLNNRRKWISFVGLAGKDMYTSFEPLKHHLLCGAHFDPTCKRNRSHKIPVFHLKDSMEFSHIFCEELKSSVVGYEPQNDSAIDTEPHESEPDGIKTVKTRDSITAERRIALEEALPAPSRFELELKIIELEKKLTAERELRERNRFCTENLLKDQKMFKFYTGFATRDHFEVFREFVREGYESFISEPGTGRKKLLDFDDELLLILVKLRKNLEEMDLAYRFNVSQAVVSKCLNMWIGFLSSFLMSVPIWPSSALTEKYRPKEFEQATRIVIDSTNINIERPSELNSQSDTYSTYYAGNVAKALVCAAPNMFPTFVPDLFPGRMGDKEAILECKILDKLEPGDKLLVDRGFAIDEECKSHKVHLAMPPFKGLKKQLPFNDNIKTQKIANTRIHIERLVGQLKNFKILSDTFPNTMADKLDDIYKICSVLIAFIDEPLVEKSL